MEEVGFGKVGVEIIEVIEKREGRSWFGIVRDIYFKSRGCFSLLGLL